MRGTLAFALLGVFAIPLLVTAKLSNAWASAGALPLLLGQEAPSMQSSIEISTQPPEPRLSAPSSSDEPPPPRPRRQGLLLESTLGVLAFAGQFRHVAPPAYMMRTTLGYEFLGWLTLLAESELAFTDTSESQDPSVLAFPIWGIAGGVRFSARFPPRLAGFLEGDVGALAAAVPHDAFANLGFRAAESLGWAPGGRVGIVWYQVDPHLAITAQAGSRAALGFSRVAAAGNSGDVPLMWDVGAGLRYAF